MQSLIQLYQQQLVAERPSAVSHCSDETFL